MNLRATNHKLPRWGLGFVTLLATLIVGSAWIFLDRPRSALRSSPKITYAAQSVTNIFHELASDKMNVPIRFETVLERLRVADPLLSPDLQGQLLSYLRHPTAPEDLGDPRAEYFNGLIGLALAQHPLPDSLASLLIEISEDPKISPTLRDYTTQHFYHLWLLETRTDVRSKLEKRLQQMCADSSLSFQATSLLTASRLINSEVEEKGPEGQILKRVSMISSSGAAERNKLQILKREDLVQLCLDIVRSTAVPPVRLTAFQVLNTCRALQALPLARQCLSDSTQPEGVRCAAIALIGSLGAAELDVIPLQSLLPTRSTVLELAIVGAVRKLKLPTNQ